jgi:regulation of enolase protein 1 (concanavalin A-like superfamily)
MAANVSVGLGVTSHSTTTLCSATIDNVSFVATPPDAPPSVTLTSPSNGTTFGAGSTIALSATATDSDGTVAHVDFYSGTTLLASISSPPYAYNWVGVGPGTYTLTATATDNLGGIATSPTVTINVSNLPSPWSEGDVGSPSPIGSSSYSNGTFTVKGSGTDISGTSDQFHFVYQAWNGDGQITARVASVQNTNAWAKAGVMIRETLAANATEAMILITPSGKASFQRRTATAGATSATNVTGPTAPYWVRLVRTGNTLTAFVSPDGVSWSLVDTATVPMATNVSVGLAVSSHVSTLLCTSVFTDVTVTTP